MSLLIEKPEAIQVAAEEDADASMSSLLELEEIRESLFPVSVEAYQLLTDDQPTELLRGIIIKKVSKSPTHRLIGRRMHQALCEQLSAEFMVYYGEPLTFVDSVPEPDIAVIRGREVEFVATHPPSAELVVEVAISSWRIDRRKALIYAEAGVREYWIVRPATKAVEIHRKPSASGYSEKQTLLAPAILHSSALPGVSVDLTALFKDV